MSKQSVYMQAPLTNDYQLDEEKVGKPKKIFK